MISPRWYTNNNVTLPRTQDDDEIILPRDAGVEGAGLVLWVGGPPDASFGFYLREAFQSQTNTGKILYNDSR